MKKFAQLNAIFQGAKKHAQKAAVVVGAAVVPAVSFAADTAQPDTTDAVAYAVAGIATYLLIKNSHFLMNAAAYVSNWASRAFGGR